MSTQTHKKAVLEAMGRNGVRSGDYPAYAVLDVTIDFVRHLRRRSVLVETNGLCFTIEYHPLQWDRSRDFEMRGDMMWVRSGSVFFRAHPKNSRREVETWGVQIADLERLLASDEDVGFYGLNVSNLSKRYNHSLIRKKEAA